MTARIASWLRARGDGDPTYWYAVVAVLAVITALAVVAFALMVLVLRAWHAHPFYTAVGGLLLVWLMADTMRRSR